MSKRKKEKAPEKPKQKNKIQVNVYMKSSYLCLDASRSNRQIMNDRNSQLTSSKKIIAAFFVLAI